MFNLSIPQAKAAERLSSFINRVILEAEDWNANFKPKGLAACDPDPLGRLYRYKCTLDFIVHRATKPKPKARKK